MTKPAPVEDQGAHLYTLACQLTRWLVAAIAVALIVVTLASISLVIDGASE